MKILELELQGCSRLELSGIKNITIKPETSIVAIIGSNGCGKSSLIQYLSPLPAEKTDFESNGFKRIRLEHKGVIYTLVSDFKENKHSFVIDSTNEELNVGGTITMQLQLVKDYFNYTKLVHQLLIGKERFTEMSPNKRKEWFTMLCDTDYTYAISVFNKAKEKHRDTLGALKKLKQHQVSLVNIEKDNDAHLIGSTIEEKNKLVEELSQLAPYQQEYGNISLDEELLEKMYSTERNISEVTNKLKVIRKTIYSLGINPNNLIAKQNELAVVKEKLISLKQEYSVRVEQYSEEENRLHNLKLSNDEETKILSNKIISLKKDIEAMLEKYKGIDYSSIKEAGFLLKTYRDNYDEIQNGLIDVSNLENNDSTEEVLTKLEEDRLELSHSLNKLNTRASNVIDRLNYYKSKEEEAKINCPNCNHAFHPNYSLEKVNKLLEIQEETTKSILELEAKIKTLDSKISSVRSDLDKVRRFYSLARNFKDILGSVAYLMINEKLHLSNPPKLM